MTAVRWRPWTTAAFAEAGREDKPVLLSIVAPWCASSETMDRTSYADATIAALVNNRFVAIRVDAERRPDISERYSLGGWPTTAFLTADGAVVGGGTFIPAERLTGVLERVLDAFATRRGEIEANNRLQPAASAAPAAAERGDLMTVVYESYDQEHGGFGVEPKFPIAAPLELALATYRETEDAAMARLAETTLDAMGWGELYDDAEGGFFRCAATRDWRAPRREKLLAVNARLMRLYLDAAETLRIERYRERAEAVLRYLQTWLADPVDGGWAGSQRADEGRRLDSALYAGSNAVMASSTLRIAEVLDDTALGEFALKSLERVLLGCYSPGAGVAHCLEDRPSVRGLLDDQIEMAAAQLDAYAATGNIVYQMMAQELVHYAVRVMWDEAGGGFFDRSVADDDERVGRMRDRLKPFVTNCEAARVLRRLAEETGDGEFNDRAEMTLQAMAPLASQQGPLAAHYLLARRDARS